MFRRNMLVGGGCAAALALCAGQAMGQVLFTPIALTGTTGVLGPNNGTDVFSGIGNSFTMNNTGQVLFTASSTSTDLTAVAAGGSGGGGNTGIWAFSGGSNNNVAAIGGTSLDGGTYNIRQSRNTTTGVISGAYPGFAFVHINDNLDFAFRENSGSDPSRYWSSAGAGGQMASTCWSNMAAQSAAAMWPDVGTAGVAPGTGGAKFSSLTTQPNQLMNSVGQYLFVGSLIGNATGVGVPGNVITSGASANSSGVWMGKPGAVSLVARQGSAAGYGSTPSALLGTFTTNIGFNGSGQMVGLAGLTGTGIITSGTTRNDTALISNRNGAVAVAAWDVIARRGDTAKDGNGVAYGDGTQYSTITATSAINNAGRVAFSTLLRNGIAGADTSFGSVYVSDPAPGTTRSLAVKNGAMPASTGLAGLKWGGTFGDVAVNQGGSVVFTAGGLTDADGNSGPSITGSTNNFGLFKAAPDGTVGTVARGGPATYADPGAVVQNVALQPGEFVRYRDFLSVSMNKLGQVAWISTLESSLGATLGSLKQSTGPDDPTISQRSAMFLTDLSGGINLIAQRGTLFEVAPGDLRMVQSFKSISQGAGEDGRQMSLDENGNFLFGLDFAITAGNPNAATATSGLFLVHVPAPGTSALLGLGGLVAVRRRRR